MSLDGFPQSFSTGHSNEPSLADVCRTCGGTLDYPKVIPRLPFYQEGTTHFSPETVKTATFSGSCGGGGPNMIYMLIPPWDMVSLLELCLPYLRLVFLEYSGF